MGEIIKGYLQMDKDFKELIKQGIDKEKAFTLAKEKMKRRGSKMKNLKRLTLKQKRFLENEGLNSEEYLIIGSPMDCYKFYHIKTKREVAIRR